MTLWELGEEVRLLGRKVKTLQRQKSNWAKPALKSDWQIKKHRP